MSESCCPSSGSEKKTTFCPECSKTGKNVQRLTVGALLKPDARKKIPKDESFLFCSTPSCRVVYYSKQAKPFYQDDLNVKVGQKVTDGSGLVCYCFNYTEQMIVDDVTKNAGKTNIPAEITAQVKAGNCFCEVTNPQGSCCLGNVNQVVKKTKGL